MEYIFQNLIIDNLWVVGFVVFFVVFVLVIGTMIEKNDRPDIPELFKKKDDK